VVGTPVAVWDLLPTFAQLAGVAAPRHLDGISLVPTLRGGRQQRHPYLYFRHRGRVLHESLRFGDWKAVRRDRGRIRLYRIDDDPGERRDVGRRHPAVRRRAHRLFREAVARRA
jgi:arylsulfatase A-like enzyme